MVRYLLVMICLFWSTNTLAVTYDQDDIFSESYPSGSHKFIVDGITSYTVTKWYLNGVWQEQDTEVNGQTDTMILVIPLLSVLGGTMR